MARLAFIADIHVGNPTVFGGSIAAGINARGREVLAALEQAVSEVEKYDALVICGDLFDTSSPNPQLIAEVQRILSTGPQTYILLGNHDMVSDAPGDHALGPLAALDNVVVIERPMVDEIKGTQLLSIPFQPGDCREWFADAVAQVAGGPSPDGGKVLAFHLGVVDSSTPKFLAHAHDAIPLDLLQDIMIKHGIEYAFCGNWHTARRWHRVTQCGALAPTGFDNPGWEYGKVATIDTSVQHLGSISIPGPRFVVAEGANDAQIARVNAERQRCNLYLQLKGEAADQLDEVRAWGVQARAVTDATEAKKATHAAAAAVREAATLQSALAKYVQQMPLGEGINRERVLELSKKYLMRGE